MAQDGSYEVKWAGVAFPYLMHHPNAFLKTENYGSAKPTGTWNGTAPRGDPNRAANEEALRVKALVINEPTSVRLSDGTSMPITGLGTGAPGLTAETVKSALAMGYRHFDCAWFYKNEAVVGAGLKAFIEEGKRSELYICSKVWNTHHRPASVRESAEQSIAELGCGYLDLLLVHWPEAWVPPAPGASDEEQILGPKLPEVDREASLQVPAHSATTAVRQHTCDSAVGMDLTSGRGRAFSSGQDGGDGGAITASERAAWVIRMHRCIQ
ncbi:MAG: hypothetical protein WDW36_004949 [Sanguina aurantia]